MIKVNEKCYAMSNFYVCQIFTILRTKYYDFLHSQMLKDSLYKMTFRICPENIKYCSRFARRIKIFNKIYKILFLERKNRRNIQCKPGHYSLKKKIVLRDYNHGIIFVRTYVDARNNTRDPNNVR